MFRGNSVICTSKNSVVQYGRVRRSLQYAAFTCVVQTYLRENIQCVIYMHITVA